MVFLEIYWWKVFYWKALIFFLIIQWKKIIFCSRVQFSHKIGRSLPPLLLTLCLCSQTEGTPYLENNFLLKIQNTWGKNAWSLLFRNWRTFLFSLLQSYSLMICGTESGRFIIRSISVILGILLKLGRSILDILILALNFKVITISNYFCCF